MKTKAIVVASVMAVVALMAMNAIYADCGEGTCYLAVHPKHDPEMPYCICFDNSCVGLGAVGAEYICGWPGYDECSPGYTCYYAGTDPEFMVLEYGEILCHSIHEEAPWCGADEDCELESFVNCTFIEMPICGCTSST